MVIVLSVLWHTDSDYTFGIFKLFLHMCYSIQISESSEQQLKQKTYTKNVIMNIDISNALNYNVVWLLVL